jgi:threonine dehydrogenase-like Zn-dependent dehydrogenase
VVVDVERVGLCGTDVEFFTGEMAYLHQGHAAYPLRPGHEWCGTVSAAGEGVDRAWLGRRVTGDTMLGCGRCHRCRDGRHHVCGHRHEIGIRGGWPGALAEQVPVPVGALVPLPDTVGRAAGALVEPGGNALRAVEAARPGPGARVLVWGPGTIGLLAAMIAAARGAEVHVVGREPASLALARDLGVDGAWTAADLPDQPYDAVIDATNDPDAPRRALEVVEPAGGSSTSASPAGPAPSTPATSPSRT